MVNHTEGFDNDNFIHWNNWHKTQYHKYWSGKAPTRNSLKFTVIVTLKLRPDHQLHRQEHYRNLQKYTWNGTRIISSKICQIINYETARLLKKYWWLPLRIYLSKLQGNKLKYYTTPNDTQLVW